jgi:hypothetical protein
VKQFDRAGRELETIPADTRQLAEDKFVPIELEIAAQQNGSALDAKLKSYRSDPDHAPTLDVLRSCADRLQKKDHKEAARKILEFVFASEIESNKLTAANMLGLAEIRIETGDPKGAVELLHRLTLTVDGPFVNHDAAAGLLVRLGHPAEAIPFLQELVTAVPWEPAYRVRLAQAHITANQGAEPARDSLAASAADTKVSYELRSTAATALAGSRPAADLEGAELKLLAQARTILPAEANHPFYYAARMRAAEKLTGAREQLSLLRAAVEDRPFADAARLLLFRSALDAGNHYLALAVIDPLTGYDFPHTFYRRQSYDYRSQNQNQIEDEDESQSQASESQAENTGDEPGNSGIETQDNKLEHVPSSEKAAVASGVGVAFERIGDLPHALEYLVIAYKLETVPEQKTQTAHKLEEIRGMIRRNNENVTRQPFIHNEVEQDHLVRPKLVVNTTAPALPQNSRRRKEVSR